jgi:hypothetical protein
VPVSLNKLFTVAVAIFFVGIFSGPAKAQQIQLSRYLLQEDLESYVTMSVMTQPQLAWSNEFVDGVIGKRVLKEINQYMGMLPKGDKIITNPGMIVAQAEVMRGYTSETFKVGYVNSYYKPTVKGLNPNGWISTEQARATLITNINSDLAAANLKATYHFWPPLDEITITVQNPLITEKTAQAILVKRLEFLQFLELERTRHKPSKLVTFDEYKTEFETYLSTRQTRAK